MENPAISGLRSRSRSKTPFLRSSCDREHCLEGDDHVHKAGRKTPVKRKSSTPVKQLPQQTSRLTAEPIREEDEDHATPPVIRTRKSARVTAAEKLVRTSDYSSEESLDRLKANQRKEYMQNEINSTHERVSSSRQATLSDFTLSPIQLASRNVTYDRSSNRIGSPALSGCSTDSSFAELTLADTSTLLERDPSREHLPYRLYKYAGEYWNKYPKTDYTYSELSKDRVELAPGQVALPNMSRRSMQHARLYGFNTTTDEIDTQKYYTSTGTTSKRYTAVDSSDDESYLLNNGGYKYVDNQHWWLTQLLINIVTSVTTTVSDAYRKVVGPKQRYPYSNLKSRQEAGLVSRAGSAAAAPFVWIYTIIKKIVTTTVTTVTETITPNHVSERQRYSALSYNYQQTTATKRRWWPWLLLLLLPAIGYGCCHYKNQVLPQTAPILVDSYKSPEIVIDADLSKRISALETWAIKADDKFKVFEQKLSKIDNIEAQIEQYSLKYLQQNIIHIFNLNENSDAIAEKLKQYFDKQYVSKDQMQVISQEIHEKLINSWKPEMDEDRIRGIIQEYLSVFEKRQMELIVERIREYVREIEIHHVETGFDVEAVKRIVAGMLEVYDADKIGLVDYALESAGGQVISTKCTELYQIKTKQYSILGMPIWWVYTSPRFALTPGAMPAECWAFQGFPGYLVVRLYAVIEVTGFSIEHMSRLLAADGKIESAPKNFSIYGLHDELDTEPHLFGEYMYDANGTSIQYFPVKYPKTTNIGGVQYPVAYDTVELRIESNHGNPTYTCLYRFRVHGNPLSDIRRATDDSIRDSET